MKGYIPVEIPTKKYIRAFIIAQLGPKPQMNRSTAIGSKLLDLLQHSTNHQRTKFSKRYNSTLRIYISIDLFRRRGFCLNENNLKNFNSFVEDICKERFYFLMDFYFDVMPSFESNLPLVRKQLGIDDDHWQDDSMKKDYYRYRLSIGKPLLYKKNYGEDVLQKSLSPYGY